MFRYRYHLHNTTDVLHLFLLQKSRFAVMVMSCRGDDKFSVEPLDCPHASTLISNLTKRKKDGTKAYVRLYPEEL